MNCQLQHIPGVPYDSFQWKEKLIYRCVHCGKVTPPSSLTIEEAQALETTPCQRPSIRKAVPLPAPGWRLLHYVQAYLKRKAEGEENRTPEEVMQIYATKCSPCRRYNDLIGACSICGCYINPIGDGTVSNKILWKSEHCDDQPPQW